MMPETENPRDEYITGVLAPATAPWAEEDIDADVDEVVEEVYGEEDDTLEDGAAGSTAPSESLAPALDPRSLPRSIGLPFTVEAVEGQPAVGMCFTWARYRQQEGGWKRHPASWMVDDVSIDEDRMWSAAEGVSAEMGEEARPQTTGTPLWRSSEAWQTSPVSSAPSRARCTTV